MELIEDRLPPAVARPRFRFGLKFVFVITTVLCLLFGYQAVRRLRANQLRSRHIALVTVFDKNLLETPPTTHISTSPSATTIWTGDILQQTYHIRASATKSFVLTIDPPLDGKSNLTIAKQLADHFGNGLDKIDLRAVDLSNPGEPDSVRTAWESPERGILLLIEVRISAVANSKLAHVSAVLIHNEDVWP